jgi:tetratricopeptide (TPR) repeat protein
MPAINQRLGLTRYEADEYYKRALEAYKKHNFDEAIDSMNYAIELLPTKAEYFAARGFFQLEDGSPDLAQADFTEALKRYPYEMLAHYGRGTIAYKNKAWDEAMEHFTHAYHCNPERGETLYYLALTYLQKGETAAALNVMARAQAAFEKVGDKRKSQADRVVKDLGRLVEKTAGLLARGEGESGT